MRRVFVVLALVTLLAGAVAGTSVADSSQPACPSTGKVTAGQFTVSGGTASIPITVAAGCTNVQVSLVAYEAPGPNWDANTASQQVMYPGSVTPNGAEGLSAGTYTLSVPVPPCYFQVDLVYGMPIAQLGPAGSSNFYHAQGRLIAFTHGGTTACAPPPPPCPTGGAMLQDKTPITIVGDTATVSVDIAPGCSNLELSLVSYKAPGPTFSAETASQQVLFSSDDQPGLGAGPHSFHVMVPSCYYQIDFVYGSPITQLGPAGTDNFYNAQHRLIETTTGGTQSCVTSTPPTPPPTQNTAPPVQPTVQATPPAPQVVPTTPPTPQTTKPAAAGVKGATKTVTHKRVKHVKAKAKHHVVKKVVKRRLKPVHKRAKPAKPVVAGASFTG